MRGKRYIALALIAALLTALPLQAWAEASYSMPYYIEVDITNQVVTVFDAKSGDIVRQMLCSSGKNDDTPLGEFIMPPAKKVDRKPWYLIGDIYVKYASRIYGPVLFHSLLYSRRSMQSIDTTEAKKLGTPASHGCLRMRWQDAEFIAENCLPGTLVKIYKSGKRNESLREMLAQESYDAGNGFSYENFLGISDEPGALSRNNSGKRVLNLQYRLRDLGLFDGELNGDYDSATVNAVRVAQYMLGEGMTGIATAAFQKVIYSDDAPTAMNVSLSEGAGGPAVKALQENLSALRLYDGALDSVFDVDVSKAVKRFQQAYCYADDGVASPEVQKAIAYEAGRLKDVFGEAGYTCASVEEQVQLAEANARAGVKMRTGSSVESKPIKRLSQGSKVLVVETGSSWSKVRSGGDEGYVKNSLMTFFDRSISVLRYTSDADDAVYTVGISAADYYTGAGLPCEVFAEYLAANDQQIDVSSLVNYVTVDTKGEGNALNLRQSPLSDSLVLDTVADGTSLKVQRQYVEWTQVSYSGKEGYLLNRYLNFWTGAEDALEAEDDVKIDASMVLYADVESGVKEGARVYDDDSDEAKMLGHLPDGARVDVLEMSGGWCKISYQGHQGYMTAENLRITLKDGVAGDDGDPVWS